jgi:hypothetical protein
LARVGQLVQRLKQNQAHRRNTGDARAIRLIRSCPARWSLGKYRNPRGNSRSRFEASLCSHYRQTILRPPRSKVTLSATTQRTVYHFSRFRWSRWRCLRRDSITSRRNRKSGFRPHSELT